MVQRYQLRNMELRKAHAVLSRLEAPLFAFSGGWPLTRIPRALENSTEGPEAD
jgi:hypothetical protein